MTDLVVAPQLGERVARLLEASSLGTPDAVALRERGARLLGPKLTGMSEEQADWERDETNDD
ncbi:hypothetical protein [Micromonospora sp. NPDC005299]|uniref:hypothetical protein n=1 Tax=Micromonospora sp. NPDC005299 TaxID=3364231 RepID=UPI00368A3CC8